MIKLYDHQTKFVADLRAALRSHRSVLAQASTGFGKTVIAAYIAKAAAAKGKRIMFTVHRRDLLTQTAKTFDSFGISYGFVAAGYSPDPLQPVQIASIGSLKSRLEKIPPPALLVVDEAHLSAAKGWKTIINHFKTVGSIVVGLTATPWRLSGEGLGDLYDHMVQGPGMGWLIENKFLSDYDIYAPSSPDLGGVHSRAGDYINEELATAMDKASITGDVITHWSKYSSGKRTLVFCVSIKHSENVARQFRSAGIMAVHIDGETKHADRMIAFKAFASGDIMVITSVQIFSEGFDLSAQIGREVPVETICLLRPTKSLSLYLQQIGRGLRKKEEAATILDHSGNVLRFGLPDEERAWTLKGESRRKKKGEEGPSVNVRQCPRCYHVHKPADICPKCGHVYEIKSRDLKEVEGELVKVDKKSMRRKLLNEQWQAKTIADLVALAKRRGYKSPHAWAGYIYSSREAKRGETLT